MIHINYNTFNICYIQIWIIFIFFFKIIKIFIYILSNFNIYYYFANSCVEENNECTIKIMLFSSNKGYPNDGIRYKTKQIQNYSYYLHKSSFLFYKLIYKSKRIFFFKLA